VGKLRIEGDADLARRLQRLAERFDPDWQRPFVQVFGEVVGCAGGRPPSPPRCVTRAVRAGALASNAAEYSHRENPATWSAREELNAFHDDVDALRDDAERLAVRVSRLRARAGDARMKPVFRAWRIGRVLLSIGSTTCSTTRRSSLAGPGAAVRAARLGPDRGDVARRAPAPGAAGTGPDLRQVRADPVHPSRPGAAGRGRRTCAAAGPRRAVRWRSRQGHRRTRAGAAGRRGLRQFDTTPLASASIAQVHAARCRRTPRCVARGRGQGAAPGHREADRRRHLPAQGRGGIVERTHPSADKIRPREIVDEIENTLAAELDLQREGANASVLRRFWKAATTCTCRK
jgi:hypothetical protein